MLNESQGSQVGLTRVFYRALGLAFCIPFLVFLYHFIIRPETAPSWTALLPLVFAAVSALLGLYLVYEILRGVAAILRNLDRISHGERTTALANPEAAQFKEFTQTVEALNKLTDDYRSNAERLDALLSQFSTLSELMELAARIPNLKDLLGVVLRRAMTATRASKGTVMVRREDDGRIEIAATEGWNPTVTGPLDMHETLAGRVVETGEPLMADKLDAVEKGDRPTDSTSYTSPSFLIMPLKISTGSLGALCLSEKAGGAAFDSHDQQFLATLLHQVGFALENSRLLEQTRRAVERLEETVIEQEAQLQDAKKKILKADRLSVIGHLIASVAHEVNNPLTSTLGYAQLLLDREPAGPDRKWLTTIFEESSRAAKITRNLLTFAHDTKPGFAPVDLNQLVRNVVALRRYDLRMRNIDLSTDLAKDVPTAMLDGGRIQQVLLNLINNSSDAMTLRNPRKIRIGTGLSDGQITIWVADTGHGIPEVLRERIFEPFFSTKVGSEHTGLGLGIAQDIIVGHKGSLDIQSAEGQGTRITIHLPLVPAPEVESRIPGEEAGTIHFDRLFALSVDDEPANAELVSSILSELGFQVESVAEGTEALERLLHENFDLVVCDIRMPTLDGKQLYRELKRVRPRAVRRIIFTSGDTADPEAKLFAVNNQVPLVAKPFVKEDLIKAVYGEFARLPVKEQKRTPEPV
jgi:signal transduction histidine kinase/CheY-like chemotaxis protein